MLTDRTERDEQKLQRSCCHLATNEFISKASDATFRRKVETLDVQFSRDPYFDSSGTHPEIIILFCLLIVTFRNALQ